MLRYVPSAPVLRLLYWSPITLAIYPSLLGSKLKSLKDSNTVFDLLLSSPLLIDRENVPAPESTFVISHLMLSLEPETNDPSLLSAPASPAPVELFNNAPLPIVWIVKGASPASAAAIDELVAPVKEPDTTLVINAELPPCSKYDFTATEVKNSYLLEPDSKVVPNILW